MTDLLGTVCGISRGRKDVLGSIAEYLQGEDRRPMVIHGASGSGKSAVVARASETVRVNPGSAVVIRRFIGATPESSSGITLRRSLSEEIGERYGVAEEIPAEFHSIVRTFGDRLALSTQERPLVLLVDALDQIAARDPAAAVTWLMPELPPYCRVVVSTTDIARSPEGARMFELEALPAEDAEGVLALWLHAAGRELRDWQRVKVLAYYSECGLPLYLRLAFEEARLWRSFDEPEACALREGLAGIIDILLNRLSSRRQPWQLSCEPQSWLSGNRALWADGGRDTRCPDSGWECLAGIRGGKASPPASAAPPADRLVAFVSRA